MVSPGFQFGTAVLNVGGSAGEPSLSQNVLTLAIAPTGDVLYAGTSTEPL
jgi:hypothetical protein